MGHTCSCCQVYGPNPFFDRQSAVKASEELIAAIEALSELNDTREALAEALFGWMGLDSQS